MIPRPEVIHRVRAAIRRYPVTLVLGARQCGKTTVARMICDEARGSYFDLEDPETSLKPQMAKLILKDLKGLVVIDEFQRQPELFSLLRVLADRRPLSARFLILGSASPELVRGVSESLAGRVAYIPMGGFAIHEVGEDRSNLLWVRGGFPKSYLAKSAKDSFEWRGNFIQSFLERDIPQLGIRIPSHTLRRFWTMLAHFHGQVWNAADFAGSMGTKEDTARHYLDILSGAFMIRQLPPWFENVGKRLVKAPKIYFRDSGLLHFFLGLKDKLAIQAHPRLGFSWEGFALEQIICLTGSERETFYYRTHAGAELDLLLVRDGRRYGFEFKYEDAPRSNKSMHVVFQDLKLEKLWVLYPGERSYPLWKGAAVIPFQDCLSVLREHKILLR